MYVLYIFIILLIFIFTFTFYPTENFENIYPCKGTMFCPLGPCCEDKKFDNWKY